MKHLVVTLTLLVLVLAVGVGLAQPVDETAFPTLAALRDAEIPYRDRYDLARRFLGVTDFSAPPPSEGWELGDRDTFIATNLQTSELVDVLAELQMVGDHIYLWVEVGQTVDESRLKALAQQFDDFVYDETRALWGSEASPGIDGDPRIHVLFATAVAGVSGYFQSDQTYPRSIAPISNQREMFFFSMDMLNSTVSLDQLSGVIAHEFQHMIRYNENPHSELWLNEGLSEITQSLLFGESSYAAQIFLNQPDTQLNTWYVEPALRTFNYGASMSFLLYIHERYGVDTLMEIARQPEPRALDAIETVLVQRGEQDIETFFADFVVANAVMDSSLAGGRYYYNLAEPPITAFIDSVIFEYPAVITDTVSQFGADYMLARDIPASRLRVTLDAPTIAPLIAPRSGGDTQFWYSNRMDLSATRLTRTFDLTGLSSASLSYDVWYDIETGWDYGYLSASGDGGATWSLLTAPGMTTENPHGVAYGPGYSGSSAGWINETVSLDAFAGGEVIVRFEMVMDDAVTQPGMALDNLRIDAIGFSDDVEAGEDEWLAEGWLITDNRLPQTGWLQAVIHGAAGSEVIRWRIPDDGRVWELDVPPDTEEIVFVLSGTAPVTTETMPYTLTIEAIDGSG